MNTCLSEFALDDLILNGDSEASRGAASHLQSCADCRHRHEERRAFLEQFERLQAGPFWQGTRRGYLRRRASRRAFVLAVPCGLAAACALAFLARSEPGPAGSYLGAKGVGTVEMHCRRVGRTFLLRPEDGVEPGDELRFVPRPASATVHYVQVASIDGAQKYTPFYPPSSAATSLPLPPPGQALDGSIRLDAAPGPERLFFVFSPVSLPASAVEQAARQHAGDLQAVRRIAGTEVESGWIILTKTSPASGHP
ncbi:MAG TPA: hypothetical protein VF550_20800 [Polyangia bacterium]